MFLGHFAIALAAKKAAPKTSLSTLLFAAEFADLLWPILLLLGLEQVRIVPGITRASPFDFVSYPISHSLLAQALWAGVLALLYFALRRYTRGAAVIAACVVSHWFLDALVHRPDIPLYPGGPVFGLGVWNSLPATLIVELGTFALGIAFYVRTTVARDSIGRYSFAGLCLTLLVLFLGSILGPPPPSEQAVAWAGIGLWLFVAWAAWADRHRLASR